MEGWHLKYVNAKAIKSSANPYPGVEGGEVGGWVGSMDYMLRWPLASSVNRRLFGSHTHICQPRKTQRSSLNAGFSALSKVSVKDRRRGGRQGESGG